MQTRSVPSPLRSIPPLATHAPELAARTWQGLVEGSLVVVASSVGPAQRAYDVRVRTLPHDGLSRRERIVADRLGRGVSCKEIAFALGISSSSIGRAIDAVAAKLGVPGRMDVVVLSAALRADAQGERAQIRAHDDGHLDVIVSLDAGPVWSRLSIAEREVADLAVAGLPSAIIAMRRGDRSTRTVANQLAQVFRKAGVSGRTELAARLLSSASNGAPSWQSGPRTA